MLAGAELATARVMGTGEEEAWDATRLGRVLRTLEEASMQACEMEVEEDGESVVTQLTAAVVAAAWQSAKKNFPGAGGYARFTEYIMGGMLQGLVCEGTVDADPQGGGWWQAAVLKVHSQGGAPQDRGGRHCVV